MKYTIISGSLQENSQSLKVSRYLSATLTNYEKTAGVELIDLQQESLMLWDASVWQGDKKWAESWPGKSAKLIESDAIILVTPEYHGMASPSIKNFLMFVGAKEVGHKPVLIVSVSAAAGGAYPITELRSSGYKNTRICYIPEHLIVRNAGKVLNEDQTQNDERNDTFIRSRIDFALKILEAYAVAFQPLRSQEDILFHEKFVNGM